MSDTLHKINENKVKQELRDFLAGKNDFSQFNDESTCDKLHEEVLNNYKEMNETQQQQFKGKTWIND